MPLATTCGDMVGVRAHAIPAVRRAGGLSRPQIRRNPAEMAARQVLQSDVPKFGFGHLAQPLLVAPDSQTRPLRRNEASRLGQDVSPQPQQRVAFRQDCPGCQSSGAHCRRNRPFERDFFGHFRPSAFRFRITSGLLRNAVASGGFSDARIACPFRNRSGYLQSQCRRRRGLPQCIRAPAPAGTNCRSQRGHALAPRRRNAFRRRDGAAARRSLGVGFASRPLPDVSFD